MQRLARTAGRVAGRGQVGTGALQGLRACPQQRCFNATAEPQEGEDIRVRLTPMQIAGIASQLEAASEAATLTTFQEFNLQKLMELRNGFGKAFEKQHGVPLTLMSTFIKACSIALEQFPGVNAKIDGEDIVYHNYSNIAVSVAGPNGIVSPVLKDVGAKSFADIERELLDLAERASANQLQPEDLEGATFTLTNAGTYGALFGTHELTSPQSANLSLHAIYKRVVPAGKGLKVVPMMNPTLTYDHRIIDGKDGVSFLVRVKEMVEEPGRFMLQ